MADIFEHVDFQVIFVVIAVIVAALQAFSEKRKKRKAEEELFDDVNRRVEDRRQAGGGPPPPPEAEGSFGDLYEEYRRQIAEDQRRPATAEETYTPSWQPPAAEPAPPPLPPELPPSPKVTPVADPGPVINPWQRPKERHAVENLSPDERAALKAVESREDGKRSYRRGRSSSARQLLRVPNGRRRAIVLREIIGPPKGQ